MQQLRDRNVRLILGATAFWGVNQGVLSVVFNLFLLARGYDAAWVGLVVAWTSLVGFAVAVPLGRLADRLGPRTALLAGVLGGAAALAASVLWPEPLPLLAAQTLHSAAVTSVYVAVAPLMTEHSREDARDTFFGMQFAVSTGAGAVGNLLGGWLPALAALAWGADPASAGVLGRTLLFGVLIELAAVAPLLRLPVRPATEAAGHGPALAPRAPGGWLALLARPMMLRFALPGLVGGIGAGLLIPLQNVFFARRFGASAGEIGLIFSWAAAAVTAASLLAPALARRLGRVQTIVACELTAIPFLLAMAVVPRLWWAAAASWVRSALMNMTNPVLTSFMMEHFAPGERATANAVATMAFTLGWAVGAQGAGLLMDRVSVTLPLWITASTYVVSAALYLRFFGGAERRGHRRRPAP